jgi:hypothetical protein
MLKIDVLVKTMMTQALQGLSISRVWFWVFWSPRHWRWLQDVKMPVAATWRGWMKSDIQCDLQPWLWLLLHLGGGSKETNSVINSALQLQLGLCGSEYSVHS